MQAVGASRHAGREPAPIEEQGLHCYSDFDPILDASCIPASPSSNDAQASCLDQGSGEAHSGATSWGSRQSDVLDQPEQTQE